MSTHLPPSTRVAVVGGGPGGLMAAEVIARSGASVTLFERMASVGRKFLLAGRGGLNLTHTEPLDDLLARYGSARPALARPIAAFDPAALRSWAADLGQTTFVGSSGRVFPSGFRATPLLRAWLARLDELGVERRTRHEWRGWDERGDLCFTDSDGTPVTWRADATVLALGGGSWPRSGSNGAWVPTVERAGVEVVPLRAANVGFDVAWSEPFAARFAGTAIKNVTVAHGDATVRGEAMVTAAGIEGGAIYALSGPLRAALDGADRVTIHLDLQPDRTVEQVAERLGHRRPKDSTSTALRRALGVTPVAIGLLREARRNRLPTDAAPLAALLKAAPVELVGVQPMARAISTAGGIALEEVDDTFMLRRRPGTFVAGEMLDWDAPTGGYLLQATFSTAVAAATGVITWLTSQPPPP